MIYKDQMLSDSMLIVTLGLDFVLPLSQQEEQEQREQPLTKIYQMGMG